MLIVLYIMIHNTTKSLIAICIFLAAKLGSNCSHAVWCGQSLYDRMRCGLVVVTFLGLRCGVCHRFTSAVRCDRSQKSGIAVQSYVLVNAQGTTAWSGLFTRKYLILGINVIHEKTALQHCRQNDLLPLFPFHCNNCAPNFSDL